ncbi:flagellar assembly protein FliH [Massilia sp. AB1]|uniref:flagellar assembly protein FliH n=1 Tax=Massilia sp. AB1 TaxID=2823371 RepID=UPI001B82C568|nr:flagellar assembly protein FliH [Massilia sp. AB1]MBQ5942892.1 flagellar assembly protein FliH [Massilia sp. AB1]
MVIPKELQSAYQRWEMASFDKERRSAQREEQPAPAPVEIVPQVVLPSVEEIEAMREAARQEGYLQGLQEGREQGYAEGRAQGYADGAEAGQTESAAELEQMRSIAATFGDAVAAADETIAADVLELALRLARGMVRTAFDVRPELIVPIVREAIGYLPVLQQPALLSLHPEDALIVRQGMADELTKGGWRIIEDATIARGGCKVETASNQIDAQAQARWHRLTHALGANVEWMGQ